jgi:hypothetical protein
MIMKIEGFQWTEYKDRVAHMHQTSRCPVTEYSNLNCNPSSLVTETNYQMYKTPPHFKQINLMTQVAAKTQNT